MRSVARTTLLALLISATACDSPGSSTDHRAMTDNFRLRISADPVPPRARERTVYKVVVRDKESGQPVEGGEGRIFATSRDGANVWDVLTQGPEVGTYYGTLNFVTAGEWAVAIQFRRDSTRPLERADWMQDVRAGPPEF